MRITRCKILLCDLLDQALQIRQKRLSIHDYFPNPKD